MIPWFEWKTISLGPLTLQVWGLFVALGMLLGVYLASKRAKKFHFNSEILFDLGLKMIVSGIIFSRVFHVLLYEPSYYLSNPGEILKVWHGGLSSFGGLLGAGIAFWWFAKKKKWGREIILKVADFLSFGAVFGWMVGRLGCVFIHDHMGKPCDCFLAIQSPDGPRLEMSILEILGMIPLAILFFVSRNKQKTDGWYTAVLFLYYGILRLILDFFRGTDTRYFGLTPGQYSAIVLVLLGVFFFSKMRKKNVIKN